MDQLQLKSAERETLVKEIEAITAKPDTDWTESDFKSIETKSVEIDTLDKEIARLKAVREIARKNAERVVELSGVDTSARPDSGVGATILEAKANVVPVQFRGTNPHHFRSISDTRAEAQYKAYRAGQWLMATLGGNTKSAKWCEENGLPIRKQAGTSDGAARPMFRAQAENQNDAGGFLVPSVLLDDLIQLREQFGVARQLFKKVTMTSDTYSRPRRVGGLTAYHMTDNDAAIESQKGWDQVTGTAQKIMTLTRYSNELSEDSIISIADDLTYEINWTFALTEDLDAFLGDGTSKYGGFIGVSQRLTDVWGVSATSAGMVVGAAGTGANWGGFTLSDFNKVKSRLPRYAALANPCWVTTTEFYGEVMEKLLTAAGGNRVADVENGGGMDKFLGKPVVFAQVLPIAAGVSTIPCYYGAFQLGADFGDRRETTIALSEHFGFANDQMAIRGTERYSINVHDVGGAASGPNPAQTGNMAGPIVGLATASS